MTPITLRFRRLQAACAGTIALALFAMLFAVPVPRLRAQSAPKPDAKPAPTATPAPAPKKAPAKSAPAARAPRPATRPTPVKPAAQPPAATPAPVDEFGKGAYEPGKNGVTTPTLIRQVDPAYTSDAMRAKIQGAVILEAIILPNGSTGDVRIKKSLDRQYGLDQAALEAAKKWWFNPCKIERENRPVACSIEMELTFRLH